MRRVGALILAAGGSTRFGKSKQFLELEGESLIRRTARAATDTGCQPVVIVAGDEVERISSDVSECEVIHNAAWRKGIGTSLKTGIESLRNRVDAVVILACDQPFVSADILRSLITRDAPIVASSYANTIGIPALFDARYFDALASLPDETGAKSILEQRRSDLAIIEFPEGAIDIDRPRDLTRLKSPRDPPVR